MQLKKFQFEMLQYYQIGFGSEFYSSKGRETRDRQ